MLYKEWLQFGFRKSVQFGFFKIGSVHLFNNRFGFFFFFVLFNRPIKPEPNRIILGYLFPNCEPNRITREPNKTEPIRSVHVWFCFTQNQLAPLITVECYMFAFSPTNRPLELTVGAPWPIMMILRTFLVTLRILCFYMGGSSYLLQSILNDYFTPKHKKHFVMAIYEVIKT